MRHPRLTALPGVIRGFSLIELMVSMAIGLVVMVAALSAYIGASGASKVSDAQARMHEDAQAALAVLSQQIRMAGNNPVQPNRAQLSTRNPVYANSNGGTAYATGAYVPSNFSVRGCDGTFSNITAAGTLDALTCAGGTNTLPDSIAVSYEADTFNTEAAGAQPTDCLGNGLPTVTVVNPFPTVVAGSITTTIPVNYFVADTRLYIGTSAAIVTPSLYCKGNGNANPQPLVENVEDMQILYGTVLSTATEPTATVAGYLTANEVVTQASLAALPVDARWDKVRTVRVCVLVRSENPVAPDADSARYVPCGGGAAVSAPDLRLRRAYTTTIVLRNRLL